MEDIKQLNLTEKDFKMLIDGLDALPQVGHAAELMADLLTSTLLTSAGPDVKRQIEHDKMERRAKEKRKNDIISEDVKILQGKLLSFKRYLIENNMMNEINDALKK